MPATLQQLQNAVVTTIVAEANHLIEGANEDVQNFLNLLVQESLEAAATNQLDLLPDLAEIVKVIGEKNRIRIVTGGERVVFDVIRIALGVATKLVIPQIPQIPTL